MRIWLYRIPSLIGAIGAVLLTYWAALAFVTRRGAALAALMMCGSVLLGVEARLAKTDAMLLLTVVAAMGAMARVYLSWQRGEDPAHPPWSWPAIFWTALAGGILIKGPLILMFVGLTILALAILDRSAAWLWRLRPVWGLMWMLVLVLPWFVAIFWRAGDAFFANSLGGDMLSKLGAQESHGAPPGLYLLLFWITFWPGARAGGDGGAGGVAGAARARRAVPAGVADPVLDRVRTRADQAAALRAAALSGDRDPHRRRAGAPRAVAIVAEAGRGLVVCHSGAGVGHRRRRRDQADASTGVSGLAVSGGGDDLRPVRVVAVRGQPRRAFAAQRAWSPRCFWSIGIYGIVMPSLTPLFPSAEIARALRNVVCVGPKAAAAGFHEPSLVFMTGTDTLLTDGSGAADFLGQGSCRFALVESRSERAFVQRAEAIGLRYNVATRIEGYNISQGKADLDRDLPLGRHGVRCPRTPLSANPEIMLALRDAGVVVAGATRALAVAFAPRRGRATGGAPFAVACRPVSARPSSC